MLTPYFNKKEKRTCLIFLPKMVSWRSKLVLCCKFKDFVWKKAIRAIFNKANIYSKSIKRKVVFDSIHLDI